MEQSQDAHAKELETKAGVLRDQGKGLEAVKFYEQAREAYLAAGDKRRAAGCTHMIGVSYKIENDFEKALPVYEQAVKEYEAAGDILGPGRVYRDMGIAFMNNDRFDRAEEYLLKSQQALELASEDTATVNEEGRNAELGITLAKLGLLDIHRKAFETAETYLMDGLMLIRKSGHAFYEMTALMHLGSLYFATGHHGRMLANLEAALGIIYEHDMKQSQTRRLSEIWGLMAHGYLAHENRITAQYFAQKSFAALETFSEDAQELVSKTIKADELRQKLNLK